MSLADGPLPPWLRASLCGTCQHLRLLTSAKGSEFALCGLSRDDPRFPRYPPQPIATCAGHLPRAVDGHGRSRTNER